MTEEEIKAGKDLERRATAMQQVLDSPEWEICEIMKEVEREKQNLTMKVLEVIREGKDGRYIAGKRAQMDWFENKIQFIASQDGKE